MYEHVAARLVDIRRRVNLSLLASVELKNFRNNVLVVGCWFLDSLGHDEYVI